MKTVETRIKYTLDGHQLVELIVNHLKVPNGVCGDFHIDFMSSKLLRIDEEGGISLFYHPESEGEDSELFDLSKARVFIETTEIERE